ncbi:MAG TPA: HAD-IA family hydrolase [Polyangiaceae bacterium]|jgi:HAD superfamily hydrolase (TIGR01509 family)|nr:HAD-IA family hydrolase [Polyangiaceae bacterium]
MKCHLALFDCDGVLVDTEPVVNRVFVELVGTTGPKLDVDATLLRFNGVSMRERFARIQDEYGWTPSPGYEHEFDERQSAAFRRELHAVPGAVEAVRAVRTPHAVVSNGSRDEMTLKLTSIGLLDAFAPNLFSAADVARSKPAPDVYLKAIATLGAAPGATVAVEDSVPGVTAALAAGLTVFGFSGGTRGDALERLGARVFHDMRELPALLRAAGVDVA